MGKRKLDKEYFTTLRSLLGFVAMLFESRSRKKKNISRDALLCSSLACCLTERSCSWPRDSLQKQHQILGEEAASRGLKREGFKDTKRTILGVFLLDRLRCPYLYM